MNYKGVCRIALATTGLLNNKTKRVHYIYEPVQVFTLICVQQRCKIFMIPQTQAKKNPS